MCKLVTAEYKRIVGNSTGLAAVSGCWWCGGRQRWCGSEIYSNLFLVFAWLLVQERIQCRANLLKKNVVQDATCEVCRAGVEDCDHLLFRCPFSSSVWTSLHVDTAGCSVRHLWCVPRPDAMLEKYYNCFIFLICWQLWKHRNGVIFQSLDPSLTRFWADCIEEAKLWPSRWPRADRCVAEAWCQSLSPM